MWWHEKDFTGLGFGQMGLVSHHLGALLDAIDLIVLCAFIYNVG